MKSFRLLNACLLVMLIVACSNDPTQPAPDGKVWYGTIQDWDGVIYHALGQESYDEAVMYRWQPKGVPGHYGPHLGAIHCPPSDTQCRVKQFRGLPDVTINDPVLRSMRVSEWRRYEVSCVARIVAIAIACLLIGCAEQRPEPGPELIEFTFREKLKAYCPDTIYDHEISEKLKTAIETDTLPGGKWFSRWNWDEAYLREPLISVDVNRSVPNDWELLADLHRRGMISWDHRDCPVRAFAAAVVDKDGYHWAAGISFQ